MVYCFVLHLHTLEDLVTMLDHFRSATGALLLQILMCMLRMKRSALLKHLSKWTGLTFFQIIDGIISDIHHDGERMFSQGVITKQDIEDDKINKNNVICNGLGAYSLLQSLLRSARANTVGLLLGTQRQTLFIYLFFGAMLFPCKDNSFESSKMVQRTILLR